MAFASRDQIRQAITAGRVQRWHFAKDGTATPTAVGTFASLAAASGVPGAMADPTTYANTTDFAGSMLNTNVSPGNRYLTNATVFASQNGGLLVYDRLGHIGGISLASTGNKTVSSSALPRSMGTNDLNNVECWVEVTTATATTAVVMSMNSYTNQAGTAARAGGTITFPATATIARYMAKLPLQAGDKGVQAVSTLDVATAASAGVCNVILLRPLAYIPVVANIPTVMDIDELPRVYDGSSVCLAFMCSAASSVDVGGCLTFAYDA